MKKALSVFCLTLLAVPLVLNRLSAGNPYLAEREFWKARALAQKVVQNPETTPPALFEKSRQKFEKILQHYPQNRTLTKESLLGIAGLLIHEKRYQEARDFIENARKKFPDDKPFGTRSQFLLGFSYEKAGDWESALREYNLLKERYPESQLGFEIPLYIARHDTKLDSGKSAKSYEEASAHYQKLVQTSKDPVKYFAMAYLLTSYDERKQWDKSLETVKEIVVAYPKLLRAYIAKIEILARRLHKPEGAAAAYQAFVDAHPKHPDVRVLKKRIEQLSKRSKHAS